LSGSLEQRAAERTAAEPHPSWFLKNGLFQMTLTERKLGMAELARQQQLCVNLR